TLIRVSGLPLNDQVFEQSFLECCLEHDRAVFCGGTYDQWQSTQGAFLDCIQDRFQALFMRMYDSYTDEGYAGFVEANAQSQLSCLYNLYMGLLFPVITNAMTGDKFNRYQSDGVGADGIPNTGWPHSAKAGDPIFDGAMNTGVADSGYGHDLY